MLQFIERGLDRRFQSQKRRQLFSRAHVCARPLQDQIHRKLVYRPLQFNKRSQLFIGTHHESLSVAMRVHNPNYSAFVIES
jgi:hypothetical protein